jgi:hypothetical protein
LKASYEQRDISVGWLLRIGAGLALMLVLVAGICRVFLHVSGTGADPNDQGPNEALANQSVRAPANATDGHSPVGNLTNPAPGTRTDLVDTNARLGSFGWVNQTQQVVHIPIEDAMRVLVQTHPPSPSATPEGESHAKKLHVPVAPDDASDSASPSPGPGLTQDSP